MPTVVLDEIDGAQGSHHIINGWAITRKATVYGISPSGGSQDTGQLFLEALAAVIAITGDRGTPYPNFPVATYLEQFVPKVVTDALVEIDIIYKGYPAYQIDLAGALTQTPTNIDANGNPITVQYTYPNNYTTAAGYAGQMFTQGCTVQRDVRGDTFTLRFILSGGTLGGEPVSALDLVTYYAAAYEGTINADYYEIGLALFSPHQLIISSIKGVTKDGGYTYEVAWTFQANTTQSGWDKYVIFKDPNTGLPPPDLMLGTGTKTAQVQYATIYPTFTFPGN